MRLLSILFFILFSSIISLNASNYYWVGGSGNWSNYAAHWATTSGGQLFHTQVPTSTDNVYFDANSFVTNNDIVFIDQTIVYCNNIDWSGANKNPTLGGNFNTFLKIYGSLKFTPQMKYTFEGIIAFESTSLSKTITTNGKKFINDIYFSGVGGEWTLQDSLTLDSTSRIYLYNGTLNTNNQTVRCGSFISDNSNIRGLNLGSSKIYLTPEPYNTQSWYTPITTNFNFNAGTSSIKIRTNSWGSYWYQAYLGDISYHDFTFYSRDNFGICELRGGKAFHNLAFENIMEGKIDADSNIFIHKGIFNAKVNINTSCTFDSLVLSPGKVYTLKSGTTQKINNALIANGNCSGGLITLESDTAGSQAIIRKANGSVNCTHLLLKDIKAIGGASFNASNSIDLGNNPGWTINLPIARNLYWVGGQGNWDDISHWSTTSGGIGGSCIPTPIDNVYFDSNSFSANYQNIQESNSTKYCKNMNWNVLNYLNQFYNNYTLKIYGSLYFNSSLYSNFGKVFFEANTSGNTISCAGLDMHEVNFNGNGGEWQLQDSLTINGKVNLISGTLKTKGHKIVCSEFSSTGSNNRGLHLDTSHIYVRYSWSIDSKTNLIFNANKSTIVFRNYWGGYYSFHDPGLSYNNLIFDQKSYSDGFNPYNWGSMATYNGLFNNVTFTGTGSSNIYGSCNIHKGIFSKGVSINSDCTFDSLQLSSGNTYNFSEGTRQTINNAIVANGSCNGGYIEINTDSYSSSPAIFYKTSGTILASYLILKGIKAEGGATFTATNSIDVADNSGWNITPPSKTNLYWVGGKGNWSNPNHWSTASGGVAGACIPSLLDNVYFDSNSFSSHKDTVTIDVPMAYCKNMNWSITSGNPILSGRSDKKLKLFGSLKFSKNMEMNFWGEVFFIANDSGHTITSATKKFNNNITFDGIGGEWTLLDSLIISDSIVANQNQITLRAGKLNTNSKTIKCSNFSSIGNYRRAMNLGSSFVFLHSYWSSDTTNFSFDAGFSNIVFKDDADYLINFYHNGANYYDVLFDCNSIHNSFINGNLTIHNLTAKGKSGKLFIGSSIKTTKTELLLDAEIVADCSFDTLILSAGHTYKFGLGTTQTINNDLIAVGNGGFPLEILSSASGSQANFLKQSGKVCADYLYMRDINVTGGASWFAGKNSSDLGNNTGWFFASCDTAYKDVWPGDANSDFVANNFDILSIGLGFNETGSPRTNISNEWIAQPSVNWSSQFANGANINHADCNGDGIIDFNDTIAVNLNYGFTHNKKEEALKANATDPELRFVSTDTNFSPGATIDVELWAGDIDKKVKNLYGVAFDISYNANLIKTGTTTLSYPTSFIGTPKSSTIGFTKIDELNGIIHGAIVRTNHTNANGYGKIASMKLEVDESISAIENLQLEIINYKAIDSAESIKTFNTPVIAFTIDPSFIKSTLPNIKIFPNPNSGKFNIITTPNSEIKIYNVLGNVIYKRVLNNIETEADLSTIASGGVYYIKFYYQGNYIETKKIVIQ